MHQGEIISDLGTLLLQVFYLQLLSFSSYSWNDWLLGSWGSGRSIFFSWSAKEVMTLGELGVVFLMFHLGMEFDLSRLRKLPASLLAVLLQSAGMLFWVFRQRL